MTLLLMLACAGRRNPNDVKLPDIAPEDYPSFEQLVAAHEAAVGGEEASSKNFYMKQWIAAPAQGLTGEIELWAHDGQVYTRSFIEGMGESTSGWTGEYGWENDPNQGPRILTDDEIGPIKLMGMGNLPMTETYTNASVDGLKVFDDQACWQVSATPIAYDEPTKLFFLVETGVNIGTSGKVPTPMGKIRQQSVMRDWQIVDGIAMPRVTETTMLTLLMVATLETFEQDPQEVPDFTPPPGVQALLEE
jgi:hypothetical protein